MRLPALLLLALATMGAAEAPVPPLTSPAPVAERGEVGAAFLAAIDGAPEVRAAQARWRAATLAAAGAGVLPDPRLWAEGTRHRAGDDGLELGVEQELPRWGERSATRAIAVAELGRARADLDRSRAALGAEVAMLIARAQAAHRRADLADATAARMRTMLAVTRAAVEAGGMAGSGAGDVLALTTRVQQMELMAADERRMAADAEDDARGCCGLDAGATLPGLLLPDPASLERQADTATRLARAEGDLAVAEGRLARSRRLPQVGFGAGWEREELDHDDEAWKASVSFSIPIQQGALRSGERAAQARAAAAAAEEERAGLRVDIVLRRARRAAAQAAKAAAAAADARRRTDAEVALLHQQVAAGSADALMRALSRLDDLQDAERAAIAADEEAAVMTADLWHLHRFPEP